MHRWTLEGFNSALVVNTKAGNSGVKKARTYIDKFILQRGGYERLDQTIVKFSRDMKDTLTKLVGEL